MKDKLITLIWITILIAIIAFLSMDKTREIFKLYTKSYPYMMGFLKIAILGTMGELLGFKIVHGKWKLSGISLHFRILVWGIFGFVFTAVFALFSFGVDGLLEKGLLPFKGNKYLTAFYKSFFINAIFGFPMMISHKITDSLIDQGKLFSKWPLTETIKNLDWKTLVNVVGFACIWFWIPAHTITFSLPAEFRVMSAALLAIVLGFIMGFAKRKSLNN